MYYYIKFERKISGISGSADGYHRCRPGIFYSFRLALKLNGFSDREVKELLAYYGFMDKYDVIKEWYDRYRLNGLEIYCPWDVVSNCHALKSLIKS